MNNTDNFFHNDSSFYRHGANRICDFAPKIRVFSSRSCCALMLFEHSAYSRIIISNYQLLSITENGSPEILDCGGFEGYAYPVRNAISPVRDAFSPARNATSPARNTISPERKANSLFYRFGLLLSFLTWKVRLLSRL